MTESQRFIHSKHCRQNYITVSVMVNHHIFLKHAVFLYVFSMQAVLPFVLKSLSLLKDNLSVPEKKIGFKLFPGSHSEYVESVATGIISPFELPRPY